MLAPAYLAADYLAALQALMPRGRAWPRDAGATQTQALSGLTPVYERNNGRANQLLVDAFPATSLESLPEWESTLGLPDPCAGPAPTLQTRRAQVVARFANTGGQSANYFITFAANLGYTITLQQYAPFRCGQSRCGHQLGNADWMFTWTVLSPSDTITSFRVGASAAGEPLATWGNAVLQCELEAIKPAHTVMLLQFY